MISRLLPLPALAFAAVMTFTATNAQAQWWCGRSNLNAAEETVCVTPQLGRLDRRMSRIYNRIRRDFRGARCVRNMVRTQRVWLRLRNACGFSVPCLRARYRLRITDLRNTC